jgi:hypothetical protein
MAIVAAVVTEDARKYWPQLIGGLLGVPGTPTSVGVTYDHRITHFVVGEGGWVDPGGGAVPRTPDPTLRRLSAPLIQDLDALVDPTRAALDQRYLTDSRATFSKALAPGDISFTGTSTLRVECLLDFADFNDDGFTNDPEIYEIGIFVDHPVEAGESLMIAYGTFPLQIKDNATQLLNVVNITF